MSILSRFLRRDKTEWATRATESATPPDALTIEPMRRAHLPEILPIELTAYPQPWSQGVFQDGARQLCAHHWYLRRPAK